MLITFKHFSLKFYTNLESFFMIKIRSFFFYQLIYCVLHIVFQYCVTLVHFYPSCLGLNFGHQSSSGITRVLGSGFLRILALGICRQESSLISSFSFQKRENPFIFNAQFIGWDEIRFFHHPNMYVFIRLLIF